MGDIGLIDDEEADHPQYREEEDVEDFPEVPDEVLDDDDNIGVVCSFL